MMRVISWISANRVLPSGFAGIGRCGIAKVCRCLLSVSLIAGNVLLAIEHLEPHQVHVNGMRVIGGIHKRPDFGGVDERVFR